MKVGDLVYEKENDLEFVTAVSGFVQDDGAILVFIRSPSTGIGRWIHPSRLEVISETR